MNPKIFTVLKNGQKISYDVILTFKSVNTKKNYVVYTDNSKDKEYPPYKYEIDMIKKKEFNSDMIKQIRKE